MAHAGPSWRTKAKERTSGGQIASLAARSYPQKARWRLGGSASHRLRENVSRAVLAEEAVSCEPVSSGEQGNLQGRSRIPGAMERPVGEFLRGDMRLLR